MAAAADSETLSLMDLLIQSEELEELFLIEQGYKKVEKLGNCLQGSFHKAWRFSDDEKADPEATRSAVVIKQVSKALHADSIAIQDGCTIFVDEDILSEAAILKRLHSNHDALRNYIIDYVDFFESDTDYYLVLEYVDSHTTLKRFVHTAHQFVAAGKLGLTAYRKMLKFVMWQLCTAVSWLHEKAKCAHLALNTDNIMVKNAHFHEQADGSVQIDAAISIKITGFGVAHQFGHEYGNELGFECEKHRLSIDHELYLAPEVLADETGSYDARKADHWAIGMVLFECITNQPLFTAIDVMSKSNGYLALYSGANALRKHLKVNNLWRLFTPHVFALLLRLLHTECNQRVNGIQLLRHQWFHVYFNKYRRSIQSLFQQ